MEGLYTVEVINAVSIFWVAAIFLLPVSPPWPRSFFTRCDLYEKRGLVMAASCDWLRGGV